MKRKNRPVRRLCAAGLLAVLAAMGWYENYTVRVLTQPIVSARLPEGFDGTLTTDAMLDGTDEAKAKRTELWQYLKANTSTGVYNAVKFNLGGLTNMKFPGSDKVILGAYRTARKIFKFN